MHKNSFPFPIESVDDVFGANDVLATTVRQVCGSEDSRIFLVSDYNVVQRTEGLGSKIGRYLQTHGIPLAATPVILSGGEKIKADGLQTVLQVVDELLAARLGPADAVLAVGGGSVFDVAGYAAAQVRGGVKIIRVPTTPASMVGAAYADYAAVDASAVKDAMRVASVPAAVLVDTWFATTVLDGVWRAGIAELLRLGLAADASLLKKTIAAAGAFRLRDYETVADLIRDAVAVRMKKGRPRFAEWPAYILEPMSDYKLPHGYATVISLCIDAGYAAETGLLKPDILESIYAALRESGALEGAGHSQYIVSRTDELIHGLEDYLSLEADGKLVLPSGVGKTKATADLDFVAYRKVLRETVHRLGD